MSRQETLLVTPCDNQPKSKRTEYRRRAARGETRPLPRVPFNRSFFDEWSADLAWLVGLIWSDGSLTGDTVSLNSKDKALLDTVTQLIGLARPVKPHHTPGCWRMHFSSAHVAGVLRRIGLTERKSLTIDWPVLPSAYEMPFLRGVIDGDGTVRLQCGRPGQAVADLQVVIYTASPKFKDGVLACFERNGIRATCHTEIRKHPLFRVHVIQQRSLRDLYAGLYPGPDVPCLDRKRAPYHQWMITPRAPAGRKPKASE